MKKIAYWFGLTFLIAACLFLAVKKFNWRDELRFKVLFGSPPRWMIEQIEADLSGCRKDTLSPELLDRVMNEDERRKIGLMLARYQIRNGQLYVSYPSSKKEHVRYESVERSLRHILQIIDIPDTDFIVSLADSADNALLSAPIFAFAKNAMLREPIILMPDFEALEGNRQLLRETAKGIMKYPWKKKISKALWRGAMTGIGNFNIDNFLTVPRSQLISVANAYPDWIDAKFSAVTQCSNPEQLRMAYPDYFGNSIPVFEHLAYKYQILVDGNSCAYSRAFWQLFSNCVIFKQESPNVQWFYKALEPYVHYIPVHHDFGDLIEKMRWAESHDKEVRAISKNAQKFASQNLRKVDVSYYMVLLLREYAKRQQVTFQ